MKRSNKYLSLTVIFSTAIALTGCLANKNNQNTPNTYNTPPNSQAANNYANAGLPLFNFSCPTGIDVHGDDAQAGGNIYINGRQAYVKKMNNNYYEASDSGVTISINRNPDGSLAASYSRQGGANGICQNRDMNSGYNNPPSNTGYNNNVTQPVTGQTPAALNDFVGARAGQADDELARRGYVLRKTQGLTSYWEETATGGCVCILTNDGRFQSLVYVVAGACR